MWCIAVFFVVRLDTFSQRIFAHDSNLMEIRLAVIQLLIIKSEQMFAYATTAHMSCHLQNFAAITL